MKRSDRENLIEHYLQGELSPAEEEMFFIEIASDSELRYEFKAYQTVEKSLVKDRDSVRTSYESVRANLVKLFVLYEKAADFESEPVSVEAPAMPIGGWGVIVSFIGAIAVAAFVIGMVALFQQTPNTHSVYTPLPLSQEREDSDSGKTSEPSAQPIQKGVTSRVKPSPPTLSNRESPSSSLSPPLPQQKKGEDSPVSAQNSGVDGIDPSNANRAHRNVDSGGNVERTIDTSTTKANIEITVQTPDNK